MPLNEENNTNNQEPLSNESGSLVTDSTVVNEEQLGQTPLLNEPLEESFYDTPLTELTGVNPSEKTEQPLPISDPYTGNYYEEALSEKQKTYEEKSDKAFDFFVSKIDGLNPEMRDEYEERVKDPAKRFELYSIMKKEGVEGLPSWDVFSKSLLRGGADEGFEGNKGSFSFTKDGIREITDNGEAYPIDNEVDVTGQKWAKNKDPRYQQLLKNSPEEAEAYWNETNIFKESEVSRQEYISKLVDEKNEFVANGGNASEYGMHKQKQALRFIPEGTLDYDLNKSSIYISSIQNEIDKELAKENPNQEMVSFMKSDLSKKTNERNKLIDKNFESNFKDQQWLETITNKADKNTISLDDYAKVLEYNGQDELAVNLLSKHLDNGASPYGNIYLRGQDKIDFDNLLQKTIVKNNKEREGNRTAVNKGFINYDEMDYAVANEAIEESLGVDYNEANTKYKGLNSEERFKMNYDASMMKFDEVKQLAIDNGYLDDGETMATISALSAAFTDKYSVFNSEDSKKEADIMFKLADLTQHLEKFAPMQISNSNPFDTPEGIVDNTIDFAKNTVTSFVEATGEAITGDVMDIKDEKDFINDFVNQNPNTASAIQGEGKDEVEDWYELKETADGKTSYKDKRRILTNPYAVSDMIGQTGSLLVQLAIGKSNLGGALSTTKKGKALFGLAQANKLELAKLMLDAEMKGKTYGVLSKIYSRSPNLTRYALGALGDGAVYQTAGLTFKDKDLNFGTGVGGYIGSKLGAKFMGTLNEKGMNGLSKLISIGNKEQAGKMAEIFKLYTQKATDFVGSRAGAGVEEVSESYMQELSNAYLQTDSGQEMMTKMNEKYGTLDKAQETMVSEFVMGMILGRGTNMGDAYVSKVESQIAKNYDLLRNNLASAKDKEAAKREMQPVLDLLKEQVKLTEQNAYELAGEHGMLQAESDADAVKIHENQIDKGQKAGEVKQVEADSDLEAAKVESNKTIYGKINETTDSNREARESRDKTKADKVKETENIVLDEIVKNDEELESRLDKIVGDLKAKKEGEKKSSDVADANRTTFDDSAASESFETISNSFKNGESLSESTDKGYKKAKELGYNGSIIDYKQDVVSLIEGKESDRLERVEDIRTKAKENGFPSQNEAIDLLMNEIVIDGESLAKREEIGKKSLDRKIATIKRLLSTDKNLTDSQKAKLTETAFNYDSLLNESNKDLEASKEADKTETKRESLMTEMGATQSEIDLENEKANTTSEESLELHIIENIEKISTTDLSDSGFTVGVKGKIPLQWVGKNGVTLKKAINSLWESLPENLKQDLTTSDVENAVIEIIQKTKPDVVKSVKGDPNVIQDLNSKLDSLTQDLEATGKVDSESKSANPLNDSQSLEALLQDEVVELESEINKAKSEGSVSDNYGKPLVRKESDGELSTGRLVRDNDNVYFEKDTKDAKGKTQRLLLGKATEVSGSDLASYGLSYTDSIGNDAKKVSELNDKKVSTRTTKSKSITDNEVNALADYQQNIESLKAQLKAGDITKAQFDSNAKKLIDNVKSRVDGLEGKFDTIEQAIAYIDSKKVENDKYAEGLSKEVDKEVSETNKQADSDYKERRKEINKELDETISESKKNVKDTERKGVANVKKAKQDSAKEQRAENKELRAAFKERQKRIDEVAKQAKRAKQQAEAKKKELDAALGRLDAINGDVLKKDPKGRTSEEIINDAKLLLNEGNIEGASELLGYVRVGDISVQDMKDMINSLEVFKDDVVSVSVFANILAKRLLITENFDSTKEFDAAYKQASGIVPLIRVGGINIFIDQATGLIDRALGTDIKGSKATSKAREYLSVGGLAQGVYKDLKEDLEFISSDADLALTKGGYLVQQLKKHAKKTYKEDDKFTTVLGDEVGLDLYMNEYLSNGNDGSQVKAETKELLDSIRDNIKKTQALLVHAKVLSADGVLQMQENGEMYLTNKYRKFDDKKWKEKFDTNLKEGKYEKGRAIITEQVRKEVVATGETFIEADHKERIENRMYNIATTDNGFMLFGGSQAIGGAARRTKNLKQKKEIDDPIQEMMGLIKDPYVNALNTMRTQVSLMQVARSQARILEHGIESGYMKRHDGHKNDIPKGWHELKGERYKVYEKENIIIKDEAKEILETFTEPAVDSGSAVANAYNLLVQFSKKQLTVRSSSSHVANAFGATTSMLSNAHIPTPRKMKLALDVVMSSVKGKHHVLFDLAKAHNVFDSLSTHELDRDKKTTDADGTFFQSTGSFLKDAAKKGASLYNKADKAITNLYTGTDNVARIAGFISEIERSAMAYDSYIDLLNKHPKSKDRAKALEMFLQTDIGQQVATDAAHVISAVYPTYSKIPKVVRLATDKLGIAGLGMFTNFAAESIRNSFNIVAIAQKEMLTGMGLMKSDRELTAKEKSVLITKGAKRMMGFFSTQAMFVGTDALSKSMAGIDDEEEKLLTALMPEYYKHGTKWWYRDANGKPTFINTSRFNSFGFPMEILNTLLSEGEGGGVAKSIGTMFEPFVNINPLLQTLMGFTRRENARGKVLWVKEDTTGKAASEMFSESSKLFKSTPTRVIYSLMNMSDSYTDFDGEVHKKTKFNGDEYDFYDVLAEIHGVKSNGINYETSISVALNREMKELKAITGIKFKRGVDAQELLDRTNANVKRKYESDIIPLISAFMGMQVEGTDEYNEAKILLKKKTNWSPEHLNKVISGQIPIEVYNTTTKKFDKIYE